MMMPEPECGLSRNLQFAAVGGSIVGLVIGLLIKQHTILQDAPPLIGAIVGMVVGLVLVYLQSRKGS